MRGREPDFKVDLCALEWACKRMAEMNCERLMDRVWYNKVDEDVDRIETMVKES